MRVCVHEPERRDIQTNKQMGSLRRRKGQNKEEREGEGGRRKLLREPERQKKRRK